MVSAYTSLPFGTMPLARPPSTPAPEKSLGSKCSWRSTGGMAGGNRGTTGGREPHRGRVGGEGRGSGGGLCGRGAGVRGARGAHPWGKGGGGRGGAGCMARGRADPPAVPHGIGRSGGGNATPRPTTPLWAHGLKR